MGQEGARRYWTPLDPFVAFQPFGAAFSPYRAPAQFLQLGAPGRLSDSALGACVAQPREGPYIWVTWLSKLLAGEAHCEWALWFKAHHKYDKRLDESFDLASWAARHAELVRTS